MTDNQDVNPSSFEPIMNPAYVTPTTGSTITLSQSRHQKLIINPSGTLLALTVALPSSPNDGDVVNIASSQIITTFTLSNATIVGALTTLAVATFASYMYSATASKWFRVG
jgi:hypothetical protein